MQSHHHASTFHNNERVSQVALKTFFIIMEKWGLTRDQARILLGNPARSTFFKWLKHKEGNLDRDTLERISYIMGIYKALHILLPNAKAANTWPKKENTAPLFNEQTALNKMLAGNVVDLADVRRFLDAQRG